MKEMKQKIAAALLAGVVLTSGVPALAAGVPAGAAPQNTAEPAAPAYDDINIKQIVSLFSKMKNTADDSRVQLIYALRPHLSAERQARADTAIRLLKLLDMLPFIKESGILKGIL